MDNKKNILFITTQYKVGERIYPIIPHLGEKYNLDLLKIYHMHPTKGNWGGDKDLRKFFDKKYLSYFTSVFSSIPDLSKYDLILADDNRIQPGLSEIYLGRSCLMIGNNHGCSDHGYETINYQKCFDGCFMFGLNGCSLPHHIPGGIPANDVLQKYTNVNNEHILVITGFLGLEPEFTDFKGFTFKRCDKHFFDSLHLLELQKLYNKKVVIKIKSRENQNYLNHIEYIKSVLPDGLDYEIKVDVEDDNLLLAQSSLVLSCPSTLALKSIQLGIPTFLFKGYSQTSIFKDYKYLIDLESFKPSLTFTPQESFIENTIQGGLTWNSTDVYLDYINQIINK